MRRNVITLRILKDGRQHFCPDCGRRFDCHGCQHRQWWVVRCPECRAAAAVVPASQQAELFQRTA